MKTLAIAAVLSLGFIDGCKDTADSPEVSAEIAARGAYAVMKSRRDVAPAPHKCCGKCTNGKVKSGDGLAWVPCPCPPECKCKCPNGACQLKVTR